jgi:hypothetical protein
MSYQAPPPPVVTNPNRRTTIRWIFALGGCAFFLIAMLTIIVGYGIWIARLRPSPIPGYGNPQIISNAADGWGTYRMTDFGWEIELPNFPDTMAFNVESWSRRSKLLTQQYSGYWTRSSKDEWVELYGYIYRPSATEAPSNYIDTDQYRLQRDARVKDLHRVIRPAAVAGVPATEVDYNFIYEGKPYYERAVYLVGPRSIRVVNCAFPKSMTQKGEGDFDRILKSVKFIPNGSGVAWSTAPKS